MVNFLSVRNDMEREGRTCHHFTPPRIFLAFSSPPCAAMMYLEASSQQLSGTRTRGVCMDKGEGTRMFENCCSSSTVCLWVEFGHQQLEVIEGNEERSSDFKSGHCCLHSLV